MGKRKPPSLGDYIVHKEPYFNRVNEGTVDQLLAMQFVYITPKGNRRFCMFSEDWSLKDGKN